jgi:chemotaxis-related protein WspD
MSHRSAAAELLDREIERDYLREWTNILAADHKVAEAQFNSILVFRISSEWFGLPTTALDEVAEVGAIRRLPHRVGTLVRGIVSLRGEVLVCVALDILLGLEKRESERPNGSLSRLVVCSSNGAGARSAFMATEVYGVMRYRPQELRRVPATVSRAPKAYTTGILPWNDHQTIGCLDADLLFRSLAEGLS